MLTDSGEVDGEFQFLGVVPGANVSEFQQVSRPLTTSPHVILAETPNLQRSRLGS